MIFYYVPKFCFKSQACYHDNTKEYLPDHNLFNYSVYSNFDEISSHNQVPTTIKSAKKFGNPVPASNERILIVDDEEDIATLFKIALERAGFIVDVYNDPLKSLSNYRAGIYDLLLLDIRMPQMSGFELYKKIRQVDENAKVCFITAFEEYFEEFNRIFPDLQEKGCFIRKPVGVNDLVSTVKSHLNYN